MSGGAQPDRYAVARQRRQRWCADARILGAIAFEADRSRAPLASPTSGRAGALLAAAWERRAGVAPQAPLGLGPLPDWAEAGRERRRELALIAGAILRARALRDATEGALLKAVADAIGEERLDVITRFFARRAPLLSDVWRIDPVAQLHGLGGEVLLRAAGLAPALQARLSLLFPVSADLARSDVAALRRIADDARMLWGEGDTASAGELR
jgi:hypothetical protein